MTVRVRESLDGHARHEECLQRATLDHGDATGPDAFVIEPIVSREVGIPEALQRRIEVHRKPGWQHGISDVAREGLSFVFVLLPVSLETMAEDLVEEHRARAPRQDRGA